MDLLTSQYMLIGWGKGDLAQGEGRGHLKGLSWSVGHWGPDEVQLLGDTQVGMQTRETGPWP